MKFDDYTRQQVLDRLFAEWTPKPQTITAAVDNAVGYITAADVYSRVTQPVVRASRMDGIAVRSADFAQGRPDLEGFKLGRDYVRADTGDDFDDAFDAVIKIEDVTMLKGGGIALADELVVTPRMNVEPTGESLRKSDLLFHSGWKVRPVDVALLVRAGHTEIAVIAPPRVTFIPTGNELVCAGSLPGRGQNIDSNSTLARHMLSSLGAEVSCLPIVRDKQAALAEALDTALAQADIVVINGGSSKGEDDLNAALLKSRGTVICHGASAAPGRPVCVAVIEGKVVVNVPGPMVATYYVFEWCLAGIIARWLGVRTHEHPRIKVRLTKDLNTRKGFQFWSRLDVRRSPEGYSATPLSLNRGDGPYIIGVPNAQFINSLEGGDYPAGSELEVELLCDPEFIPEA
ncbi:MAG: molybdopterin molybdotransferase MoeA [Coriobacteriales bacterium]|jgi:molybdopterin molybdotransferase/putative molybdopterin biosynthesis protein|nr:molybdopterin molybdotransferase MoeA [Coriobacteriales bacterium]